MATEASTGILGLLAVWQQRVPLLPPFAVRFDLSEDLYEELRSHATYLDKALYGEATVPRRFVAEVVVQYEWPEGVLAVTWSDGTVESYQF